MSVAEASFDVAEYKRALACYTTGVAVLTTRAAGGERIGITVNSFTSVSLEPPLILVCLGKFLASFGVLSSAHAFNVNILRKSQRELSEQFARAGSDKWRGVRVATGCNGAPLIEPNLAVLECRRYRSYRAGDHNILVGRVERFSASDGDEPLLYFRGQYRTLTV